MKQNESLVGRVETIDKKIAKNWLSLNEKNRKINEKRVRKYVDDMNNGRWRIVPDAIGFNRKGKLINGQHRLTAFLKSELNTIDFFVMEGLEDDSFDVTDSGKVRNGGDVLSALGYQYSTSLASTARYMYNFDRYNLSENSVAAKAYVGNNDIIDTVESHPGLVECHYEVYKMKKSHSRTIPELNFLIFVYYVYSSVGSSAARQAQEFCKQVIRGANLNETDPSFVLREKLFSDQHSKNKMDKIERCALILKAFNAHMKGQSMQRLFWGGRSQTKKEPFPKLLFKREINKIDFGE